MSYRVNVTVWDLPEESLKILREVNKLSEGQWKTVRRVIDDECIAYDQLGRTFYNAAMFLIFLGIGFVIAPFNLSIAFIVAMLGIVLEAWQAYRGAKLAPRISKRAQEALQPKSEETHA